MVHQLILKKMYNPEFHSGFSISLLIEMINFILPTRLYKCYYLGSFNIIELKIFCTRTSNIKPTQNN
jgi:hypothetical protein